MKTDRQWPKENEHRLTMVDKLLHRKLKIEQHEPQDVNPAAPEM